METWKIRSVTGHVSVFSAASLVKAVSFPVHQSLYPSSRVVRMQKLLYHIQRTTIDELGRRQRWRFGRNRGPSCTGFVLEI